MATAPGNTQENQPARSSLSACFVLAIGRRFRILCETALLPPRKYHNENTTLQYMENTGRNHCGSQRP